ncbi:MAG TPA: ABC-type transport auxiliary lipoprotein family protein [Candidatus Acidoferrales bacterium]|nr:ABC-type transport auxiliary lipoprotein family protein [Candidatus Acidoferrales bacterium]
MSLPKSACAAAALAVGAVLLLTGCGAARPIKYYSLDPPEVAAAGQRTDASLLIAHFHAPTLYRDTRIVYRNGGNEMGLYEEHRWVEAPALMVEEMVLQYLRRSGRYKSVQNISSNAQGDYIVHGRVERFEQVEGKPLSARVWLRLSLYDPKAGATVWAESYERDEQAAGDDFASIVAALDKNLQQGVIQLAGGIDQYITAHPRPAESSK